MTDVTKGMLREKGHLLSLTSVFSFPHRYFCEEIYPRGKIKFCTLLEDAFSNMPADHEQVKHNRM